MSSSSLKSTIVSCYSWLTEILLWLIIVAGAVLGYYVQNHVLYQEGWFLGILLGALAGFIVDVVLFTPVCIILDIRDDIKTLANK